MPQTMPSGVHLAIQGKWSNGRPIVTSWHAVVIPVDDRASACAAAAERLDAQWTTHIIPLLSDNYSFDAVSWVDLHTTTGATGVYTSAAVSGAVAGTASTPPSVGALITKGFTGSGRSFRSGRTFLPGALEGDVDEDGLLQASKRTAIQNAFTAFLNGYNTTSVVGVIASTYLVVAHTPSIVVTEQVQRRVPDKNGVLVSSPITAFSVDTLVAGVKRRVRG